MRRLGWARWPGGWWVRLFGRGLAYKNTDVNSFVPFSERNQGQHGIPRRLIVVWGPHRWSTLERQRGDGWPP